jgi:hypothetical protein
MRQLLILTLLMLISSAASPESLTERRLSSADIGTIVFMAPESWQGFETYDDLQAASVYELSARREKFNLRLSVQHFSLDTTGEQMGMDQQIIARLDGYLKYAIAEYLENPDQHEVRAARFGPRNYGIYARVSHRNPAKDSYPYYTHGARILGNKFIVFSLQSNDQDLSVLKMTLDVVNSVEGKNEWANAPDSYLCNVEQLTGFSIVDDEWDAISSKKVKHSFILRRSRDGDAYAESSEWVFTSADDENADTLCDNEFIANGFFLCTGTADEEFRMDTKTLRFVYAYLGGYYDVPQGALPDEESPKPQLGIGSCTAR